MKNIPIIFPIALVVIIVTTFFSGAYTPEKKQSAATAPTRSNS